MSIEKYKEILKKSHQHIDSDALGIIKKLKDNGFDGYLVGGGVRDLLVGLQPKDFDIATNALPNEVKRKVSYSFIIGRRFKLVHTRRGDKTFEVATYRREATAEELETIEATEVTTSDENFFGTLREDSFRRDFTVNALFYDPLDTDLVDYCGGLDDIASHTLRIIGDPNLRLKEDPIRILRAIRLSQKLNFQIETELRKSILENAVDLQRSALPRRREEWLKIFRLPNPELALWEMYDLGVMKTVIPTLDQFWQNSDKTEEFLSFFKRFQMAEINKQDPVELFAAIIYSYLIADHGYGFQISDIIEAKEFVNFYRDELGIFKAEMISIFLGIQMIQTLSRQEFYLKKGDRRRKALLNNQYFDLGLKLGLMSGELTAQDYLFWLNEKKIFLNKPD